MGKVVDNVDMSENFMIFSREMVMNYFKVFFIALFLIFLFACGKPLNAEGNDEKNSLTVIIVPDFSFSEVKWLKEKGSEVWKTGGMSAMNIRPDGPYSYLNNMVTISTGTRSLGVEGWNAYVKGETEQGVLIEQLYQQWTGNVIGEQIIFHPLFHRLVDKNNKTTYRSEIGILGQILKDHGVTSYVIGNSDGKEEKVRYGPLLTMDQQGFSQGRLDGTKECEGCPFGVMMDHEEIISVLSTITQKSSRNIFVVEWGDLVRLYKQKGYMTENYFYQQYEEILTRLDQLVGQLIKTEQVLLLSPMVHFDAYQKKERLAPLFYWESGIPLYLQSDTTRQSFLVSNLDIVPTILNYFDINVDNLFLGKPINVRSAKSPMLEEGLRKIDLMSLIFKTRNAILSSYISLLVLLLVITSVILILKEQKGKWKKIAKILLISGMSSPLWFLITPYSLYYIQPKFYLILLILISYLTGYIVVKWISNPIFFIISAVFFVISVDLLMGNFFLQRSYLGYDPVIGARFYGIGNEYAGVYLITGLLLLERPVVRRWYIVLLLCVVQLFLLSSTYFGANAGATLSCGIMFGYFGYRYFFPEIQVRKLMFFSSIFIVLLVSFLFLAQVNGKETHIGFAFEKMFQGDFQYIFDTAKRKLEMNWKIFRYSNWTQLFVTTYLLIAFYLWRKKEIVSSRIKRLLIQTGVVGSIALLLLNDSGVVAAATSMFIIVSTSYYWALEEL